MTQTIAWSFPLVKISISSDRCISPNLPNAIKDAKPCANDYIWFREQEKIYWLIVPESRYSIATEELLAGKIRRELMSFSEETTTRSSIS